MASWTQKSLAGPEFRGSMEDQAQQQLAALLRERFVLMTQLRAVDLYRERRGGIAISKPHDRAVDDDGARDRTGQLRARIESLHRHIQAAQGVLRHAIEQQDTTG